MWRHYLTTAWRNIWKNRVSSVINVVGLSIGMATTVLIVLWITQQVSFDRFHQNGDSLYKVWNRSSYEGKLSSWDITAAPLGPALKKEFPEVKAYARSYWPEPHLFSYKDSRLTGTGLSVDPAFLTMFSFPLLTGSQEHALDDVNDIILTETLAKKLFGNQDPQNKLITLDNQETLKVSGVMKDPPANTQFKFEYLLPWSHLKQAGEVSSHWNTNSYYTYIQLKKGASLDQVNQKIAGIYQQQLGNLDTKIFLYPIAKWHLYGHFENGKPAGGLIERIYLLGVIAFMVLLIACINFMNLSTASSEGRTREIGVRKVIGANRHHLIIQFLSESLLLSLLSGMIATLLVAWLLPWFNALTASRLVFPGRALFYWAGLLMLVGITGFVAGSYPAFLLSSFRPVKGLRGQSFSGKKSATPRKMLVVVQFTVALILISSTIIIYRQLRYAQNRDNGYDKRNLVELPINGDIQRKYPLIKQSLLEIGAASAVCKTSLSITVDGSSSNGFRWQGSDPDARLSFSLMGTTGDFVRTFDLNLIAGRDIDLLQFPSDSGACLLNEAAVKAMGLKDPVGQIIRQGDQSWTVVGVVGNFIMGSPYAPVNPLIVKGTKKWENRINVRLNSQHTVKADIGKLKEVFEEYNPAYPFEYQFVDQEYAQKFGEEQLIGNLAKVFSFLTIMISCLGLYGVAMFVVAKRKKEIGVRKVLGASVKGIVAMLSKDFLALVLVAVLIATPIAWYLMNHWLQGYAYRITIHWWIFLISGLLAMTITLMVVGLQTVKAATVNPVKSLGTE